MTEPIELPQPSKGPGFVLLHTLIWPEVAASKKPVGDRRGYLVAGPDRRNANALMPGKLWRIWQADVQAAIERPGAWPAPPVVQDYFLRTKNLSSPPKEGMDVRVYGSNPPMNPEPVVFDDAALALPGEPDSHIASHIVDAEKYALEFIPKPMEGETMNLLDLDLTPDASGAYGVLDPKMIVPLTMGGLVDSAPKKLLTNPPRFATSFSGMQEFLQCPRKWAASKYFKTVPYEEGPEAAEGNRGHKTAENYLLNALHGGKLPVEEIHLQRVKRYCDFFLNSGATLHVEKEMCCTKALKTCGWKDWNTVWFRGKADLIAIKNRKLTVADWKFGKIKDDPFQIRVMIALADLYFGDLFDTADGKLIFVKESDPKKAMVGLPAPVEKADISKIWEEILAITHRMEIAWETENFRMQTNGLCKKYCGDRSCPHCGRR